MNADLERIIRLQQLEDAAEQARRTIADEPIRQAEFDAKLAAAQKTLDDEKALLAANQAARRDLDKHLAEQQTRLSKYKNQLMEVKTNREYQAMQKEIETAQHEIQVLEDSILERMLEFDELTKQVKAAEKAFAEQKKEIEAERVGLAEHLAQAKVSIEKVMADRAALVPTMTPTVLVAFEKILRVRKTSAVATVIDGRCSACQVRMRPQPFMELRNNDKLFQCESCQRFLYLTKTPAAAADAGAAPTAPDASAAPAGQAAPPADQA